MILSVRRHLLVFLALLQLVAPLLHAHSGNDFARFGWHLPDFEIYSVENHQNSLSFQSLDCFISLDDAIVSLSQGIQNRQNNADDLPLLYFSPSHFCLSLALISCEVNFSPQPLCRIATLVHPPQSPRAPPLLS